MKNRFPIRSCTRCKTEVPAEAGIVWKWRGRWYGRHADCAPAAQRPAPPPVQDEAEYFGPDEPAPAPKTAEAQGFRIGGWY